MCHTHFFTFGNTDFKALGSEKFCFTARLGFQRCFGSLCNLKQIRLKSQLKNKKNVTRGVGVGVKRCPKIVTYYSNSP